MNGDPHIVCDGCGRPANTAHIARRLQRLEWSTRARPVHIQTLYLGLSVPGSAEEYLYSPVGGITGEAATVAEAGGVYWTGRDKAQVLAELQRNGVFLAYLLECPAEPGETDSSLAALVQACLPQTTIRIAKSIKPRKIVALSGVGEAVLGVLRNAGLGEVTAHPGEMTA